MTVITETGFVIADNQSGNNSYMEMTGDENWCYGAPMQDAWIFDSEQSARDFIEQESLDITKIQIRRIEKITCIQLD